MYRREMLKRLLGAVGGLYTGSWFGQSCYGDGIPKQLQVNTMRPVRSGWIDDPVARQEFVRSQAKPFLSQQDGAIKGSGKGKVVLLYKLFEELTEKPLATHRQEIGDCVSHAFGLGVDVLTAVRVLMFNQPEKWVAKSATEIIYAGSRVEASTSRLRGDGSLGVWAAEFIREWGVLLRQEYLNGDYNYTDYSGSVARKLGKTGVPDELEPLCREHPVKTCSIVRSWEECRDSVANGYPVAMCSNTGFNTKRDKDGFLSRSRRPWYHAMIILGIDDKYKRPGGLIQNSWGKGWVSGPTRHDQPVGSFWADASAIDRAMKQGDSIALSGYVGYPRIAVPDYQIW